MKNCHGFFARRWRPAAALLAVAAWQGMPVAAQAPASTQSTASGQATQNAAKAPAADRNIYAAGRQVRPAAQVQGDYSAMGAKVVVDQPVGGDAMLAGGSVDVRAPVGDDVRVGGGDIGIESSIGGELFATGGNITLTPTAVIGRSAALYGSDVTIAGRIGGDLRVTASRITLDGEVGGKAKLVADEIVLGPKARITGALTYVSPSELRKAEGATIGGPVVREEAPAQQGSNGTFERSWERSFSAPWWGGGLMTFLAFLAAGALFLLLVPRFATKAAARIRYSPWAALGLGFATAIATPVLAVLLFVTLLGIPLGIALLALYPLLLMVGFLVGVVFIGEMLVARLRKGGSAGFGSAVLWFALALVLTVLLSNVPFVGGALVALLSLAGVGACVLELYGRRKGPGAPLHAPPEVLLTGDSRAA